MFSIIHIIGALVAIWVYNDAKKFGHSMGTALFWAVGNIAMVAIFFPAYLIFGRKQVMKSNRNQSNKLEEVTIEVDAEFVETKIDCPMCGRKVEEDYKLCPYCGFSLKPTCAECGIELQRDWKSCPNCQTPTSEK